MSRNTIMSAQKDILVNFLKEHPELQSARFSPEFTYKMAQKQWLEVTQMLNSVPNGPQKEWRQWRKTWQDLKKNIKTKAVAARQHSQGTGGGKPLVPINNSDLEILELINSKQIDGIENIPEDPIHFVSNVCEEEIPMATDHDNQNVLERDQNEKKHCQPSTSKQTLEEHDYIMKSPRKITKRNRLQNSLQISKQLLHSIDKRNVLLNEYYNEKIKLMQKQSLQIDKDFELRKTEVATLIDIKNILKNNFHNC